MADPMPIPTPIALRAADASAALVLDFERDSMPRVLHWGADLGPVGVEGARELRMAAATLARSGIADITHLGETWSCLGDRFVGVHFERVPDSQG